ncbi:TPA: Lar family restriction alleviation protein [Serratia marcescens]
MKERPVMPANELKPCPFCGGPAVMLHQKFYLVECDDCETNYMAGPIGIGWHKTAEEAAASWNKRPSEERLQKRLQRIDSMLTESVEALKIAEAEIQRLKDK